MWQRRVRPFQAALNKIHLTLSNSVNNTVNHHTSTLVDAVTLPSNQDVEGDAAASAADRLVGAAATRAASAAVAAPGLTDPTFISDHIAVLDYSESSYLSTMCCGLAPTANLAGATSPSCFFAASSKAALLDANSASSTVRGAAVGVIGYR